MTTRIAPGVGANLLGQHSAERNQDATAYVGNLDPQVLSFPLFPFSITFPFTLSWIFVVRIRLLYCFCNETRASIFSLPSSDSAHLGIFRLPRFLYSSANESLAVISLITCWIFHNNGNSFFFFFPRVSVSVKIVDLDGLVEEFLRGFIILY